MPLGMTRARSSCAATRTIATRSNSPVTENTSETPSSSAIAAAASGIASISHWIKTTAWTLTGASFGNVVSGAFEHDRETLAAADAQGREAERHAAMPHLVGEREDDPRAAHPDRMAERDAAAANVHAVAIELQLTLARDDLRGERLVDLDQIDVGEGQPRLVEHLLRRRHGADPHDLGRHPAPRPRDDLGERLPAFGLGASFAHEHHRGGAVGDAAGVAGGDAPSVSEDRLQPTEGLHRRVGPRMLV